MKVKKKYIVLTVFIATFITVGLVSPALQPLISDRNTGEEGLSRIYTSNSDDIINQTDINLNDTEIISLFESTKIDINTSEFAEVNSVDYTEIQFIFSDGSQLIKNMTPSTGNNFTYTYTPSYDVPTGEHKIYFQIYDDSDEQLNLNETKTTFKVKSNYYAASFVEDELYLGDMLDVALTIKNISGYEFKYNVSIVDSTDETTHTDLDFIGNDIDWFNRSIKESVFSELNKEYYVKVNLTDTISGKVNATYFPFSVLNNKPDILENTVSIPSEIYRSSTNNGFVSLNITDVESEHPDNLTVSMTFTEKFGEEVGLPKILSPDEFYNYSSAFHIGPNNPTGTYYVNITATDLDGGSSSYITTIQVKNNLPVINSYDINGQETSGSISVNYGDNLDFTFNITDEDSDIKFVTVSLLGSDGQWLNITQGYREDMTISISSYDLVQGTWYVYITVQDSDGGRTTLTSDYGTAPQQIRVIPDILSDVLPWIALVIGIILGLIIGTGVAYKLLKKKIEKGFEPKKAPEEEKKKSKGKKEKAPEEVKEEAKEEEEEEEVKPSKRKIKRGF